jgi:6-phosphogluconolactonase
VDEIATPRIVIGDKEKLRRELASEFMSRGAAAIAARGRFVVALSGGSVATEFYPALAHLPFDWSRTDFFWVDERAVPPSHQDSNYRVARANWLGPANVPARCIHRMEAERNDLEQAAADYKAQLFEAAGKPPHLDLALLGVGPDGHIASIFPDDSASSMTGETVAIVRHSPKPPPVRLTLTLDVLTGARRPLLIAFGLEKAEAVRAALTSDSVAPAARLVRASHTLAVLLDEEAASLLPDKVE